MRSAELSSLSRRVLDVLWGRRTNCLRRGKLSGMASNVVNLNRFRKKKLREEKAKQAEINRIKHGLTNAERERERTQRERAQRGLEGKRLERGPENVDAPRASPGESDDQ